MGELVQSVYLESKALVIQSAWRRSLSRREVQIPKVEDTVACIAGARTVCSYHRAGLVADRFDKLGGGSFVGSAQAANDS